MKSLVPAVFAILLLSCSLLIGGCAQQKAATDVRPETIAPAAGGPALPGTTDEARGATY
jgi:hypothetical protein